MALTIGTQLGSHEITALLGKGGMGEVYRARDLKLKREVAIKILPEEFSRDADRLSRFQGEAEVLASLNHPNIAQIYGLEESNNTRCIVMELVEGETLQERLKRGAIPVDEALPIAKQIAEALEAANEKGIIHRDLKPANIGITAKGAVKVLDFGLAKVFHEQQESSPSDSLTLISASVGDVILGTPAYMSPEQAKGGTADKRSDVWAFGCVLYEMLVGLQPFTGETVPETLAGILKSEPDWSALPAIPPSLMLLLHRCLEKEPARRMRDIADVRMLIEDQLANPSSRRDLPHGTSAFQVARLPSVVNHLIGRDAELAEVRALLLRDDIRLLNLTGPAGIGKTRLAIEVSHKVTSDFEAVWFIGLENILEPTHLAPTILHGLGLQEQDSRSPRSCLIECFNERSVLLVLDNFEQIAESAPLLSELLTDCPRLKILVTSRSRLHLRAEHEYSVPPLSSVGFDGVALEGVLDAPCVALFLDRAQGLKPTLEVARAIVEICMRLDGLPLAIELAAARARYLPPKVILERLRNRFQLLAGGARDLPARQQTLRKAIDWSYDHLGEHEQALFQCLAVFAGGCTLESIEAIFDTRDTSTLDVLTSLADKSLLRSEEDQSGSLRFRMLETIREYATERLIERADTQLIRGRHAAHYLALVEGIGRQESAPLNDLFETEHNNCRAALEWFLTQRELEHALRMALALWPFWEARGYWTEGRQELARVLAGTIDFGQHWRRAKAFYAVGVLADAQGDYAAARNAFEGYLALQRNITSERAALAPAINNLGIIALRQGDFDAARNAYQEALEILRTVGSQLGIAQCLNNLGHVAFAKGDFANARTNYLDSLAICRQLNSTRDVAWTLSNLADVALTQSELIEAEKLYSESFAAFRQINDQAGMASSMSDLGSLAVLRGEFFLAAQLYQESAVLYGELGDKRGIARVLEGLADIASARGHAEDALRIAGAAAAVRSNLGIHRPRTPRLDCGLVTARAAVGKNAERVWKEGERLSLEQALEYALTIVASDILPSHAALHRNQDITAIESRPTGSDRAQGGFGL